MTNNYISINGKKIPLTNEQVEQITNIKIGMPFMEQYPEFVW